MVCETYICDDRVFDGSAIFSFTCSDGGSFTSVSTCSKPNSSFVEVSRDAVTASSTAVAVITWETVSRSGTARTSSTGAAPVGVPRDTVKFIGEFTNYTCSCRWVSGCVQP